MLRKSLIVLACTVALIGCVEEKIVEKGGANGEPDYGLQRTYFNQLKNINEYNNWVRTRSRAVVRVQDVMGTGTGFFVDESGVLATNFHVLGNNCFREGCKVSISFDLQRGMNRPMPQEVWVEPIALWSDKDISLWQVYFHRSTKTKFTVDASRTLKVADLGSIKAGDDIKCIGHPLGTLKKVSEGKVISVVGGTVLVDAPSLGGQSGSPCFNDKGDLVSILFAGVPGRRYISKSGFFAQTITSSLEDYLGYVSVWKMEGHTKGVDKLKSWKDLKVEEIVGNERQFRNLGGMPTAKSFFKTSMSDLPDIFYLDKLDKCKKLVEEDLEGVHLFDVTSRIWSSCLALAGHLQCSTKAKKGKSIQALSYFDPEAFKELTPQAKFCPEYEERNRIREMLRKALDIYYSQSSSGNGPLYATASIFYRLETSEARGNLVGRKLIENYIERQGLALDADIVSVLISYARKGYPEDLTYKGEYLSSLIFEATERPGFQNQVFSAVYAFAELTYRLELAEPDDFIKLVKGIAEADDIEYATYLRLEHYFLY